MAIPRSRDPPLASDPDFSALLRSISMPSSKIVPDAGGAEAAATADDGATAAGAAAEPNEFQKFLARGQYEGTFLALCHSNPTLLEAARVAELDLLSPDELAERSRQRHAKLRAEAEAFQSKFKSLSEEERADPKSVGSSPSRRCRHRQPLSPLLQAPLPRMTRPIPLPTPPFPL